MGKMGIGYGSEFHLLRYLGRHRQQFGKIVLDSLENDGVTDIERIEWLDYPYDAKHICKDGEWQSLDFLTNHGGESWKRYWPDKNAGKPNRKGMPSWDAVGIIHYSNHETEWLLVEAKAHEAEFASQSSMSKARDKSREIITESLERTFNQIRASDGPSWQEVESLWLGKGYQVANRLACLHFLHEHKYRCRLLYVCFIGDTYKNKKCPTNELRWKKLIRTVYSGMGIPDSHVYSKWIHYIFPNVNKG